MVYGQNIRDNLYVLRIVSVVTILGKFQGCLRKCSGDILGYTRYVVLERGVWISAILKITSGNLLVKLCCSRSGIRSFVGERGRAPDVFRSAFLKSGFVSVVVPDAHQGWLTI